MKREIKETMHGSFSEEAEGFDIQGRLANTETTYAGALWQDRTENDADAVLLQEWTQILRRCCAEAGGKSQGVREPSGTRFNNAFQTRLPGGLAVMNKRIIVGNTSENDGETKNLTGFHTKR